MNIRHLFVTSLYQSDLGDPALLGEIAHSVRTLADDDGAGRRWCREHHYPGYTSYASLDDLPRRDPVFDDLARRLRKHAAIFAKELGWTNKLRLDSLWVNLLKSSGHHSGHIHPHAVLSGTLYIEVSAGSGAIRFEDPRLPMMMAAPSRGADVPESLKQFVSITPTAGMVLMWESWLRHEVMTGTGKRDRLSVSFNFA